MRARWIFVALAILSLGFLADQGNAQLFGRKSIENAPPSEPKIPIVTAPFEVARISKGVQFKSYLGVVDNTLNETIVAQGACVIALGTYREIPRVAKEIQAAAAKNIVNEGPDSVKFLTNLLQFGRANQGDVHCRIERGSETGCIADLCATSKAYNAYLVSYGPKGNVLARATDACGGSLMRVMDDCEPKAVSGTTTPAGFALCIETQIEIKRSKDSQLASVVVGYGKVPKAIKSQMGASEAVQATNCGDRGFSGG